VRYAVKV